MDGNLPPVTSELVLENARAVRRVRTPGFETAKRLFDLAGSLLALPVVGLIALALVLLNPIWNRGPLLFVQKRMGQNGQPFNAYKFRTMSCVSEIRRGPNDPVETDRITPLGRFLRKTRLDEVPQFWNVLFGEMSIIGPRPDYWDHALHYAQTVPGYQKRHAMRPGITGLAQVHIGYAEGEDGAMVKTRFDLRYIRGASFLLDLYVLRRTIVVICTGFGAR